MWNKSEEIDDHSEWYADWSARDGQIRFEDQQRELKGSGEVDMKWKETGSSIDFEPAPAAMHVARCIRVIDLGTARDAMYDKDKHDCFLMWEIPNEMKTYKDKDDKEVVEPFTIGKFYTMSLSEGAHLRTDLESWRSKSFTEAELEGFDSKNILGKPCMINVIHTPHKRKAGKIVASIKAVTPMPKGLECPPAVNGLVYFSLEDFDQDVFEKMSSGLKKRIEESYEYKAIANPPPEVIKNTAEAVIAADEFDDIPF